MKVKICGITDCEDALGAVKLGVDALGFIFAPSPRRIAPEMARFIIKAIPPFIKTVGVFVNEEAAAIREHINYCGLDLVQLHGDETPDFCSKLIPHTIKAVRIKDESSLEMCSAYQENVRALLLDTYAADKAGGTGKTFDWQLAFKIREVGIPVILSGGLDPSNIAAAIKTVRPYAVDVNSGVEERPGKKSFALMKELMEKIVGIEKMNVKHRTSNIKL
ncbi:MAG: phosphoribosylanthranilate isomerase [Desulfobacterales bacterium]|nr:MAG: phosphoribosylanthranilate isomerase [Desulfobacterales bacterium]